MNANEIRSKDFHLGHNVSPADMVAIELLQEMAAQMAELNEPVVVNQEAKPEWVEFLTTSHREFSVKISDVTSVLKSVDPSDPERLVCMISTRNGPTVMVIGDYGIICAKLGIPMEARW